MASEEVQLCLKVFEGQKLLGKLNQSKSEANSFFKRGVVMDFTLLQAFDPVMGFNHAFGHLPSTCCGLKS